MSRGIWFSLHKRELALPPCRMFATRSRAHNALPLIKPTRYISNCRNRTPASFSLSLSKLFSFEPLFSCSKAFHHKQIHFHQTPIFTAVPLLCMFLYWVTKKDILLSMLLLHLSAALLLLSWQFSLRAREGRVDEHHQKHLVHMVWNGCEVELL